MKGIILAGGKGTRLYPLTHVTNKHLLPVYDKPMIYHPLSTLMLAGIREILLISSRRDVPLFEALLGDGSQLGLEISYAEQAQPRGIAEAFVIGADFIHGQPCCLVLGDNVFYGEGFSRLLQDAASLQHGAMILACHVSDPEHYGVVEFDATGKVLSLVEKPQHPRGNYVVPGLYFYDADVTALARTLAPGPRGELEITDLNRIYLERGDLRVKKTGRGIAWLDTGTSRTLLDAASFIEAIEARQGLKIACLEEIAWRNGWIDTALVLASADALGECDYSSYLRQIVREQNAAGPAGGS